MKVGKALGLSGIVVEMIPAAGDTGASMINDLAAAIFPIARYLPSDWEQNFIVCLLTRVMGMHWTRATTAFSNWMSRWWKSWRGLWMASLDSWCQLTIPSLTSSQAGTTGAIFVVRQLQVKYLAANKRLYMALVDLEKAFDESSEGHLVGAEKTWCGVVDCATGPMHRVMSMLVRGTVKEFEV